MKISKIVTAVGSVMAGGLLAAPVLVFGVAGQGDVTDDGEHYETLVPANVVGDGNSIVAGAYKKLGALDPTSL